MAGLALFPFAVIRQRGSVIITSPPFDLTTMSEESQQQQWGRCTNVMYTVEKERIISQSDIEPFFWEYLKKTAYIESDIKSLKRLKSYQVPYNLMAMAFLFMNNIKTKSAEEYFHTRIIDLVILGETIEEEKKNEETATIITKPNIKFHMEQNLSTILAELQELEDKHSPDILKWLRDKEVPKHHMGAIESFFTPRLREIEEALAGTDKELAQAYPKKSAKALLAWYQQLMFDLNAYKKVKQSLRKARTRKPKPASKVVGKLKYQTYNDEHKITSIKPETIIGAQTLWIFNTKTRKLCVYNASTLDKELSVKGSYIVGWDAKTSTGKTLRKPPEQLKTFFEGGKVAQRKLLEAIRGKPTELTGKINKDILLLKVY
mgnify:CR=1 FL=1